ncbi:hypothetical protein E5161_07425 [Cohnella pontilimi]|uniref:Integrase n=1 Tax=Cohnella pontilimi TaxID=2564100 RepID=A0A4U0FH01_9BACL|nr:tyrosine-type recombinase/integrase [Cohnella pontilimi]TJY42672.1 hypothetical protein E5161_07425 [Cohnella pontilimi]
MPLYDEEVQRELHLEKGIQGLAEKFGPYELQQALFRLDLMPKQSQNDLLKQHVSLSEAVAHYFSCDAFLDLARSSQDVYRYEMNLFVKYCHHIKGLDPEIKEVSSALFLQDYLSGIKKQNTRSKKAAFLRSFLRETNEHYFNRGIEKIKRTLSIEADKNRLPRAFTKEQLDELLVLVRLGREAHRNFTILWTFLGSGIRLNELCCLQVGDVNVMRQEILVRGKGKKGFKQPSKITKSALDVLCAYIHFRYNGIQNEPDYKERYIFSDDKGMSPLHHSTVQKMMASLIDECITITAEEKGNYQLSVHSLRHSFALYLLQSGVTIYDIKDLMRHNWLTSTEVYLKVFDNMLVTAIDKHPLGNLKASDFFGH